MDLAWCLVCEKKLSSEHSLYCSHGCQLLDFQMIPAPVPDAQPSVRIYEVKPVIRTRSTSPLDLSTSFPPLLKRQKPWVLGV